MPAPRQAPVEPRTEEEVQPGYHPPPAQRRKERLRRHIIEVATDLYTQNGGAAGGFDRTTAEAIAQRADISVRTFFRYFATKADVIFLDGDRANEDLLSMLHARLAKEHFAAAAVGASMDHLHWFISDPINRERLRRSLLAPEFKERLALMREQEKLLMAEAIAEQMRGRPDAFDISRSIATIVRGAVWQALDAWAHDQAKDPEGMILRIIDALAPIVREIAAAGKAWQSAPPSRREGKTGRKASPRASK